MSWSIVKSNNRMIDDILYTLIIEHLYCFSKKISIFAIGYINI